MKTKMPSQKREYKVCDRCRKMLSLLQFESNNLLLEREDDSLDETDSGDKINTFSKETAVQLINDVVVKTGCTKENKQTKETSWI
jgi:hypothetical protein